MRESRIRPFSWSGEPAYGAFSPIVVKASRQERPLPPQAPHFFTPEPLQCLHSEELEKNPPGMRPVPLHWGHLTVPAPLHVLHVATASLHC